MRARRGITARYLNVADSVKKEVASPSFPFFPPSVISGLPEIIWIWQQIASELLAKIRDGPSVFTEKLVVELLAAMGYGKSRQDAGHGCAPNIFVLKSTI